MYHGVSHLLYSCIKCYIVLVDIASATSSAVKSLRAKALLDEVPKTQIARATGVNRATVGRRLKSRDMMLGAFIDTSLAIGADPVRVLADAITREEKKAPAATGASEIK